MIFILVWSPERDGMDVPMYMIYTVLAWPSTWAAGAGFIIRMHAPPGHWQVAEGRRARSRVIKAVNNLNKLHVSLAQSSVS